MASLPTEEAGTGALSPGKRGLFLKSRNGRPAWRDWVVGRAGLEPATTPL